LFTALDTAQVALRRRQVLRLLIPSLAAPVLGWAAWRIFPTSKPADVLTEFGAVRLTHPAGVWRSVFLGDGTTLVTACGDRQVRLWPAAGGDSNTLFTAYPRGELGYLALAASPTALRS